MKIMHIAPTEVLQKVQMTGSMAIAPKIMELNHNPYTLRGIYSCIDNGAFEGKQLPFSTVIRLAAQLDIPEMVLPDVMGDQAATSKVINAAIIEYMQDFRDVKVNFMAVLHKFNLTAYSSPFVSVIGLPKCLKDRQISMIEIYKHSKQEIHFLGLQSIKELTPEANKIVRSCDTSLAFKATCGQYLLETLTDEAIDEITKGPNKWLVPVNFDYNRFMKNCNFLDFKGGK